MTENALASWVAALVVAAVVVPFTLLSGVQRLTGAFLFWTLFALVVIALIVRTISGWKAER